tara:strand:+ start:3923 stop:4102 length:180 start_codon:yes stop_codon:yes gene_type:complete
MPLTKKDSVEFYKMLDKLKTREQQAKAQSDALEMDREYLEHCEHFFKGKPHKRHRLLGK